VLHKYNSLKYRTSKLLGLSPLRRRADFRPRAWSSLRIDHARVLGPVNPAVAACLTEMRAPACLSGLIVRRPSA
jgi:hypothetical protein